ncbi:MAG: type II toxin-antitoxin system PemK/MazF family toxin [Actinomycetales bacterium]
MAGLSADHVRRGDIALVVGGIYASKPRPAVVIQDDLFDCTDSVIVCPLTSSEVDAPLLRVAVPANDQTGVAVESFLMVDKLTAIRRKNVGRPFGRLPRSQMVELERRIVVLLGLAS